MWYSFSGVKKPGSEPEAQIPEQNHRTKPRSRFLHGFPTLLDPKNIIASEVTYETCPSGTELIALWKQYLKNVHPLVMIFFDWEIESLVMRASKSMTSLTHGEQALVLAILLITTMSLSEEQCVDLLHEKRLQALARFQKATEDSLIIADFVATSDRLVLQALILYLVSFTRTKPFKA